MFISLWFFICFFSIISANNDEPSDTQVLYSRGIDHGDNVRHSIEINATRNNPVDNQPESIISNESNNIEDDIEIELPDGFHSSNMNDNNVEIDNVTVAANNTAETNIPEIFHSFTGNETTVTTNNQSAESNITAVNNSSKGNETTDPSKASDNNTTTVSGNDSTRDNSTMEAKPAITNTTNNVTHGNDSNIHVNIDIFSITNIINNFYWTDIKNFFGPSCSYNINCICQEFRNQCHGNSNCSYYQTPPSNNDLDYGKNEESPAVLTCATNALCPYYYHYTTIGCNMQGESAVTNTSPTFVANDNTSKGDANGKSNNNGQAVSTSTVDTKTTTSQTTTSITSTSSTTAAVMPKAENGADEDFEAGFVNRDITTGNDSGNKSIIKNKDYQNSNIENTNVFQNSTNNQNGNSMCLCPCASQNEKSNVGGNQEIASVPALPSRVCSNGLMAVSVEWVGTFCTIGPVCSGQNSAGVCPGPQVGLEQGSVCRLVGPEQNVYGCKLANATNLQSKQCENSTFGKYPVSVAGAGTFCMNGPSICSRTSGDGNCPVAQTGLEGGSRCDLLPTGVYGCLAGAASSSATTKIVNAVLQSDEKDESHTSGSSYKNSIALTALSATVVIIVIGVFYFKNKRRTINNSNVSLSPLADRAV